MRDTLDHLPVLQQRELARVTRILLEEFDRAIAGGTQVWRRSGRILKIILYGSYARGTWVDAPTYRSDYDILVIVNTKRLTDDGFWTPAEDRLMRTPTIRREANLIVHTLGEVNDALKQGRYFWTDIAREGVALYAFDHRPLARAEPLTSADALLLAEEYHEKLRDADVWMETSEAQQANHMDVLRYRRNAAFNLHQAIETAYACLLLMRTQYLPHTHNIAHLRSLSEGQDPRLIAAWPHATRRAERPFNLIKRAYRDARYARHYDIGADDLVSATASAHRLRDAVEHSAREWLAELRERARQES